MHLDATLSRFVLSIPATIALPFGPDVGDTTLNLQLDDVSDVYVSGTIHIPDLQVDAEIYDRLYVSCNAYGYIRTRDPNFMPTVMPAFCRPNTTIYVVLLCE